MLKTLSLPILVLDDEPTTTLENLGSSLESLGAIQISVREEPKTYRLCAHYKLPWSLGEQLDMPITVLGLRKSSMMSDLSDRAFMKAFQVIFVDRMWQFLLPKFDSSDFGLLGGSIRTEDAGITLSKYARAFTDNDPITVIFSQVEPPIAAVQEAIEAGAYQFFRKGDWIALANLLVYAVERLREQKKNPAIDCTSSGEAKSALERAVQNSPFYAHKVEARLLNRLARAESIDGDALSISVGMPHADYLEAKVQRLNDYLLEYGLAVVNEGDRYAIRGPTSR